MELHTRSLSTLQWPLEDLGIIYESTFEALLDYHPLSPLNSDPHDYQRKKNSLHIILHVILLVHIYYGKNVLPFFALIYRLPRRLILYNT